ncbi:MAG: hypothetical protein LBK44_00285 [Spirochaetales bacterium]|jgi:hypothetical protein|nr:hypothetical protein [Spirochaetales bacterium]
MNLYHLFAENAELTRIRKLPPEECDSFYDEWRAAKAWRFRRQPAGKFLDWHPANKKLLFTVLSGQFELGASDGSLALLGPGDACIISDYGKGHTGRVRGGGPCEILHVEID